MDSLVGKTISHYRIIERIGAGGMGVVYRAEDTKLGRTVALKFLPPEMTRDRKAKERFVAEARAASAIEHSNICTIYEVDEIDDDRIFISMACYEGKTLRDRIAEGPLEIREALDIASQAAHGLAKAHAHGIVHRDIKPGNIFITEDKEVKIVDFGLAKLAGQVKLTSTGKTMGTVSYMSPEQARGDEIGPRTDIWALGVVLYEMITRELPFKGDYDVAVVYSIMNDAPPAMSSIRPGVPEELENIVKKALARNQADRYENANDLYADLNALKQRLDFSTFTGRSEWKFENRKRRWIFALAATVAVAAAAIVWWVVANREGAQYGLPGQAHEVTSSDAWQGDPAISPDGGTVAYTSNESGNKDIYITNVRGRRILNLTNNPAPDYYPTWSPNGDFIAFVSERGGSPGIWKTSSLGGGATLLVGNAVDPAISPKGDWIAFSALQPNGYRWIGVTPLANPGDVRILTGPSDGMWEHQRPAWSPDGKTICYATRQDLWVVSSSGGPARRLSKNGMMDYNPAWSSDGKYVYFSSERGGTLALWRIGAKGGDPERCTQGPGYESDPSVSRDGSRFAYITRREPGSLYIRDMKSKTTTKLAGIRSTDLAAIAPDGSKVVFASDRGGSTDDLWIQPIDKGISTGQPWRLTEDTAYASCPAFSRDGKWIAYYRILGETRDIYTIPVSGDKPIRFTDDPAPDFQPAWSPDGTKLTFASERGDPRGRSHIWIAPVSKGKPAGPPLRITSDTVYAIGPAWSPDGSRVAYTGDIEGSSEVWIVPADGRTPGRQITSGAGALTVRWDSASGSLFVSGSWGEDSVSIRRLSPEGGKAEPIAPPIILGPMPAFGAIDVSFDGRFVLFPSENSRGNIWVHEAKKGTF